MTKLFSPLQLVAEVAANNNIEDNLIIETAKDDVYYSNRDFQIDKEYYNSVNELKRQMYVEFYNKRIPLNEGFFQNIIDTIKRFFKWLAEKFKNLFGRISDTVKKGVKYTAEQYKSVLTDIKKYDSIIEGKGGQYVYLRNQYQKEFSVYVTSYDFCFKKDSIYPSLSGLTTGFEMLYTIMEYVIKKDIRDKHVASTVEANVNKMIEYTNKINMYNIDYVASVVNQNSSASREVKDLLSNEDGVSVIYDKMKEKFTINPIINKWTNYKYSDLDERYLENEVDLLKRIPVGLDKISKEIENFNNKVNKLDKNVQEEDAYAYKTSVVKKAFSEVYKMSLVYNSVCTYIDYITIRFMNTVVDAKIKAAIEYRNALKYIIDNCERPIDGKFSYRLDQNINEAVIHGIDVEASSIFDNFDSRDFDSIENDEFELKFDEASCVLDKNLDDIYTRRIMKEYAIFTSNEDGSVEKQIFRINEADVKSVAAAIGNALKEIGKLFKTFIDAFVNNGAQNKTYVNEHRSSILDNTPKNPRASVSKLLNYNAAINMIRNTSIAKIPSDRTTLAPYKDNKSFFDNLIKSTLPKIDDAVVSTYKKTDINKDPTELYKVLFGVSSNLPDYGATVKKTIGNVWSDVNVLYDFIDNYQQTEKDCRTDMNTYEANLKKLSTVSESYWSELEGRYVFTEGLDSILSSITAMGENVKKINEVDWMGIINGIINITSSYFGIKTVFKERRAERKAAKEKEKQEKEAAQNTENNTENQNNNNQTQNATQPKAKQSKRTSTKSNKTKNTKTNNNNQPQEENNTESQNASFLFDDDYFDIISEVVATNEDGYYITEDAPKTPKATAPKSKTNLRNSAKLVKDNVKKGDFNSAFFAIGNLIIGAMGNVGIFANTEIPKFVLANWGKLKTKIPVLATVEKKVKELMDKIKEGFNKFKKKRADKKAAAAATSTAAPKIKDTKTESFFYVNAYNTLLEADETTAGGEGEEVDKEGFDTWVKNNKAIFAGLLVAAGTALIAGISKLKEKGNQDLLAGIGSSSDNNAGGNPVANMYRNMVGNLFKVKMSAIKSIQTQTMDLFKNHVAQIEGG